MLQPMNVSESDPILLCPECRKPIGGRVYNVQTGVSVEWKLTDDTDPWSTSIEPNFISLVDDVIENWWVCHECGATIESEHDFIRADRASS